MIRGAIFDVDGTVLDSMSIWDHAAERYLKKRGREAKKGLSDLLFSMTMQEGAAHLRETYGLREDEREIIAGINEIVTCFYQQEVRPKVGAAEFLTELKDEKVKITAATSTDRFLVEAAFQRLGLMQYFDKIFTCSEVGAGKNEPKIFLEASSFMGTRPEETWVFEDGLYAIRTADRAGYHTVGIYDASSQKEQEEIKNEAECYLTGWDRRASLWDKMRKKSLR